MPAPFLLAWAAATAAPLPPAPTVPSAPLIYSPGPRPIAPPVTFDVEVRLGVEVLWSGPMRVSERSQALFERRKSDAAEEPCADPAVRYGSNESSNLNVSLQRMPVSSGEGSFRVSVNWTRPVSGEACLPQPGTRTISFAQGFVLDPNGSVTANGDGGLSVRLHRR